MKASNDLRTRLRHVPQPVASKRHFLLWREEWNPKRQVLVKAPYYTSGRRRSGVLGTDKDLRKLVTLEKALAAYEASPGSYDGIGLALVGDGVAAFDLDNCLTPEGDLLPDHAGRYIAERAEAEGAYIEISPSGKGLRILGMSGDPTAYSRNGLEYWGEGRYVTLTGSVWANPRGWRDLTDLRASLPSREPVERDDEEEESLITNRVIEELRSALANMESDERDLWIRMGHALKTVGARGKTLWMEWSAKSHKFNEEDAEAVWDSFRPDHTNYKAVFAEAQANWDWENPRSRKAEAQDEGELLDFAIDLGEPRLHPTEFVLDGFIPVGVSLVAGSWGAGKSTNLIPLFSSVAHLAPEDWGFRPVLRRPVIWITEAPEQARDTIYSITQAGGSAPWEEFKKWFHLVPSRRLSPKALAKLVKSSVAALTYTLDNGFAVRPVVVLDTVSANLDLENESDNSEVGAAMSRLKESLPGVPLVLVGHTPKSHKTDPGEMTFRGAGAWEADAVATYFLISDPDTALRFMTIGKVRFTPDYTEISFGSEGGRELVDTQWGDPQSKAYMHGVPQKSSGSERRAAQEAAKEERRARMNQDERTRLQNAAMRIVDEYYADERLLSRSKLLELVGAEVVSTQKLRQDVCRVMVEAGLVREEPVTPELRAALKLHPQLKSVVVPATVHPQDFFDELKGKP